MTKISTLKFHVSTHSPNTEPINDVSTNRTIDEQSIVPDRCIKNIMDFARSYRVAETGSAGKIEMVLN